MNQTDVERIVNRNHDQFVSQSKGCSSWRKAHCKRLLGWAALSTLGGALTLILQAVGQMGDALTAALFYICICCAMFFLGRYAEFRFREK